MPSVQTLPRVAVLGPVVVASADGGRIEPAGATVRALVAALALNAGGMRSADGLADDIWGDDLPQNPKAAVQTLVSRLRALAGHDMVRSSPAGYALGLADDGVDLSLARRAASEAKRLPAASAERLRLVDDALALWSGEVGADLADAPVGADLARDADALRDDLLRLRVASLAAQGQAADAVDTLQTLCDAHPFDEPLHAELMEALAAAGRDGDALAVFAGLRDRLRDGLGTSPGATISAVNVRLLRAGTAAPQVRIGIRAAPNALIGRDGDLDAIAAALTRSRLVTVLGPGGLGKTRVAHAVAAAATQPAVIVVALAGVRDDDDVPAAIAAAMGISEATPGTRLADGLPRPDLRTRLIGVLGERATLLVLDNCEQIIDGVAAWVADMLESVPTLRVLATSRTPLAVAAEAVYPLAPLDTGLDATAPGPAVALFLERARAVRPDAALPPDVVARLCEHLDGLPLAIELAAARVRTMTPTQIEERLKDRFALLTSGDRSAPERHRTLQAVIEWSWDLLDQDARRALATLSLLPGGFSAETAAGVLIEESADDLLDRLVAQSLLVVVDDPQTGGVRFRMLETVREFGIARLGRDDQADAAWLALSGWARAFCEAHGRRVFEVAVFREVRAEHDNLIAVMRHAITTGDDLTTVLVFALLSQSWVVAGAFAELQVFGFDAFDAVLRLDDARAPADAVAVVLFAGGIAGIAMQDPRAMRALARLRILRRRRAAELNPIFAALVDLMPALPYPERLRPAVDRLRMADDPALALAGELILAQWGENEGEIADAMDASVRAWELASDAGRLWFQGLAAISAAQLAAQSARPEEALEWLDRATRALEPYGVPGQLPQQPWVQGSSLLGAGRIDEARALFETLSATAELTEDGIEAAAVGWFGLAELARMAGDASGAVELYERAIAAFGKPDQRSSPWYLMILASFVAAVTEDASLPPEQTATLARRLRTRAVAAQRLRPGFIDRPVLGTVLIGWSSWALSVDGMRQPALEALALAEGLGARQDLPALHLAHRFAQLESLFGAAEVDAARAAAAALSPQERLARGREMLSLHG